MNSQNQNSTKTQKPRPKTAPKVEQITVKRGVRVGNPERLKSLRRTRKPFILK
jgi:hypothetical protein